VFVLDCFDFCSIGGDWVRLRLCEAFFSVADLVWFLSDVEQDGGFKLSLIAELQFVFSLHCLERCSTGGDWVRLRLCEVFFSVADLVWFLSYVEQDGGLSLIAEHEFVFLLSCFDFCSLGTDWVCFCLCDSVKAISFFVVGGSIIFELSGKLFPMVTIKFRPLVTCCFEGDCFLVIFGSCFMLNLTCLSEEDAFSFPKVDGKSTLFLERENGLFSLVFDGSGKDVLIIVASESSSITMIPSLFTV
jgi:hypothetical protein